MAIDKLVLKNTIEFNNIDSLSNYFKQKTTNKLDLIRGFHVWISTNIKYDDYKIILLNETDSLKKSSISDVLKTKKGICSEYSLLFHELCIRHNIKSYIVSGISKNEFNEVSQRGHAWNVVEIDSAYLFIDNTWAASLNSYYNKDKHHYEFNDKYFLTSSDDFLKSHFPLDPVWQLREAPIDFNQFKNGEFQKIDNKTKLDYKTILKNQESLNKIEQAKNKLSRINSVAKNASNKCIQENIMYLTYNISSDLYNSAISKYNKYIGYRNKRFKNPKVSEELTKSLIENAIFEFEESSIFLDKVENHNLKKAKKKLNQMIIEFSENAKFEKEFLKKYYKAWKPFRFLIFFTQIKI